MTIADFEVFSAKLVTLAELLDAQLSESKQLLYFEALQDLDLDDVLQAITQAARTCTFFPKPVELRTLSVGDDAAHTETAWQNYKQLAARVGGYQSPTFDDPALAATLVAVFGSWEEACWVELSPEMWASKRKEFDRVYRPLRRRGATGPVTLPGFIERENALKGFTADGQRCGELTVAPAALPASEELV